MTAQLSAVLLRMFSIPEFLSHLILPLLWRSGRPQHSQSLRSALLFLGYMTWTNFFPTAFRSLIWNKHKTLSSIPLQKLQLQLKQRERSKGTWMANQERLQPEKFCSILFNKQ